METLADRCDRLDKMIRENRIVRHKWGDGKERACLLLALVPECDGGSAGGDPRMCPANVLPWWMAHLVIWIDDAPSAGRWRDIITSFASLVRRSGSMPPAAWRRLEHETKSIIVREFMTHAVTKAALDSCLRMLDMLDREAFGEKVDDADRHRMLSDAISSDSVDVVPVCLDRINGIAAAVMNLAPVCPEGSCVADRIIDKMFASWERWIMVGGEE